MEVCYGTHSQTLLNLPKSTDSLKTEKIGRDPHAVFKYISIGNRKISWPVLVLTIPFGANFK